MPPDFPGSTQQESNMSDPNPITTVLNQVLRLPDVERLTGRKRSSVYEDIAAGRLPKQIKLGPRAVGWLRSDIETWLAERISERDKRDNADAIGG
jgi:prophage regulatory protein